MLRWRLIVAAAIIAALIGLYWLDAYSTRRGLWPGLWLLPAAVFFTVAATAEALALARRCGTDPLSGIVYLANLALVLAPWAGAVCRGQRPWHSTLAEPVPPAGAAPTALLALAVLLVFLGEMGRYRKPGGVMANVAAAVFVIVYVGAMLSSPSNSA